MRDRLDLHDLGVKGLECIRGVEVVELGLVRYSDVGAAMFWHRGSWPGDGCYPSAGRYWMRRTAALPVPEGNIVSRSGLSAGVNTTL
jgi:hypothetical protein